MTTTRTRRALAGLTAAALVGGGATLASAANPAPDSYAFVARGDNPIDALAAAPLAGRLDAPVVLTPQDSLTAAAADALTAADPDVVVIAGGTGAVSADVQVAIGSLLPDAQVRRVAGDTRYTTAQALANEFASIDPSFLMADGTANHAESADTATSAQTAVSAQTAQQAADSDALGGLAADRYQFSQVMREGSIGNHVVPAGQSSVQVLPTMTIDVPADGMLDVDWLGTDVEGNAFQYIAVLDWEGPLVLGPGGEAELFDKLLLITSEEGGGYHVPARVAAGTHTVRVFGIAGPGDAVQTALRSLTVHYTSGVEGQWEEFQIPAPTAAAAEKALGIALD